MYQKFRIIVASFSLMLLCFLSSTATLSYFTDTDSKFNSFTIGNASTSLSLYDDLSSDPPHLFDAAAHSPLEENVPIPLYLQATNDGNIPVYQRFRIVLPLALADSITFDLPNCSLAPSADPSDETLSCETASYSISYNPSVLVDNVPTYAEYYLTGLTPLATAQTTTESPLSSFTIKNIANLDPSVLTCSENNQNNCAFGLNIYSDAIQTAGFEDALSAFLNFPETY
ncbi:hypothetical protein IJH89_02630 [Candidatus Saccharibacteria bacterium]|nr:hypothetical protein [Candidatus Saccharibacteria bacterium]